MMINEMSLHCGLLKIDLARRKVFVGERFLPLRNKEFLLLEFFIRNFGVVLTRTMILEKVWDRNICCPTNTVDVHVSSLRKKLNHYFEVSMIKTVYCVGYIFEPNY